MIGEPSASGKPALSRRALVTGALSAGLFACERRPARAPGSSPVIDLRERGARADGKTNVSSVLAQAISEASSRGGGTIVFRSGEYLTGPIRMVSNLTLVLEAGAVLKFSRDFDNYLPMVPLRWEGTEVIGLRPLIYADGVENVTLEGRGTIDGQGHPWWEFYRTLRAEQEKTGVWRTDSRWQREFLRLNRNLELPDDPKRIQSAFLRPPLLQLRNSSNLSITGITLRNSPFWTINPVYCDNIRVSGVTIVNPEEAPNTDGINAESCSHVHVSDCHIDVGDDCITIKSGRDAEARRIGRPAENYTITNSTMRRGHGGVVIGSEMSGGVKNVVISNCVFDGTDRGIRLKSTRGRGGVVEGIRVTNVVMRDIREQAVVLNLFYSEVPPEPVSERTPAFRNIHLSGLTGSAHEAIKILGLPEQPVEDVSFLDVNLVAKKGISIQDARDVRLSSVRVEAEAGSSLTAGRVERLELFDVGTRKPHANAPTLALVDIQVGHVHGCLAAPGTGTFLSVTGAKTAELRVAGNHLSLAERAVVVSVDVPQGAVSGDSVPPTAEAESARSGNRTGSGPGSAPRP